MFMLNYCCCVEFPTVDSITYLRAIFHLREPINEFTAFVDYITIKWQFCHAFMMSKHVYNQVSTSILFYAITHSNNHAKMCMSPNQTLLNFSLGSVFTEVFDLILDAILYATNCTIYYQ